MSKCDNCLCNPVCDHNKYGWENCNNFKDKSLFVELPCEVGDEAYCVWMYDDFLGNVDDPFIQKDTICGWLWDNNLKIIPSKYEEMTDNWYTLVGVYATKYEAEQRLKEIMPEMNKIREEVKEKLKEMEK